VELREVLRAGVDPDLGRDGNTLPVHDYVEMHVNVEGELLGRELRETEREKAVGKKLVLLGPRSLRPPDPRKRIDVR